MTVKLMVAGIVLLALASTACDPAFKVRLQNDLPVDVKVYGDPPTASKIAASGRTVELWGVDDADTSNIYRLVNRNTGEDIGCIFASFEHLKSSGTLRVRASEAKPCP